MLLHYYLYIPQRLNNNKTSFYVFTIFIVHQYEFWPETYKNTDFVNLFMIIKYDLLKISYLRLLYYYYLVW